MTTKGAIKDKELAEALRIAQEAERAEEEELMRKAIEESQKLEQQAKAEADEEAEMIRQAIEMSKREEEERKTVEAAAKEAPKVEPVAQAPAPEKKEEKPEAPVE